MRLKVLTRAAFVVTLATNGCQHVRVDLEDRKCSEEGLCVTGYACHPESGLCVATVAVGCDDVAGLCPWRVATGDPCDAPGAFIPCADGVATCDAGCRTCSVADTWSACTAATCSIGEVWSCSDCANDCRLSVIGATPSCSAVGRCEYTGACWTGFVDLDGAVVNGCELRIGPELCDGIDNDQNGDTDEGFDLGNTCGVGACIGGGLECDPFDPATVRCDTMPGGSGDASGPEICDGLDNDCDGSVDNGFTCAAGATRACGTGAVPLSGTETCDTTCQWGPCEDEWWNADWNRRIELGIDTSVASTPLTDFPLLVRLNPQRVTYAEFLPGGDDIRFIDADGVTQLPYEIERWDAAGESLVWVRVPTVPVAPAVMHVTMYYDNATATPAPDPATVWSDSFAAVWHLDEAQPGNDNPATYRDSVAAGHHGHDRVISTRKAGAIGRGQGFESGDRISIPSSDTLSITDVVTIEAWVDLGIGWARTRVIDLTPATARPDFQVRITFDTSVAAITDGTDLRFFDTLANPVPHWIESWDGANGYVAWVRVPLSGTDLLHLFYDNPDAPDASDPRAVFDLYDNFPGVALDTTLWALGAGATSFAVAGNVLSIFTGGVTLANPLPFDIADGYFLECTAQFREIESAYSGTVLEASSSPFTAANNGAADATVFMMRGYNDRRITAWTGSGSAASYDASSGTVMWNTADDTWYYYATEITPSTTRYYRDGVPGLELTGITWTKKMRYVSMGMFNGNGNAPLQTTEYGWIRVRKSGAQPTVSVAPENAAAIGRPSSFGLGFNSQTVLGNVADVSVAATAPVGWHYLVLTYDGAQLRLWLDAAQVAVAPQTGNVGVPRGELVLGNMLGVQSHLDEVRVSTVARSDVWLTVQFASMTDALIDYGASEAWVP